ncbi:hypothetical protein MVEN_00731000 [Mycena venus]|uniref:Uncharacterized protein n=1 Tax=Mycena venus TaxID=2733690 RepID=A0A8H6YF59_9AGAR|nr:hypothetical protein MVEN_00731000 [Mycena venus]
MHRRAVPSMELAHHDESTENFGTDDEPATPIRSRDNFFHSRTGAAHSLFPTSGALSLASLILHSLLVATHVILLGVWAKELEHRVIFSLKNQRIASFLITAISTTIGTVYSAVLVFITQTLSMRRNLQRDQTLTATHDTAAAWTGIGSALFHLWSQKAVPASVIGVLSTVAYLSSVLILHITTPALFSLEAFNASRPVIVGTHGLPSFNWSTDINGGLILDLPDNLMRYVPKQLSFLPTVFDNFVTTLGLQNGTIYEVVAPNEGTGNVTVNATNFDITCGYLPQGTITPMQNGTAWNATWPGLAPYYDIIPRTQPGIIASINRTLYTSVIFYSTIPILDSSGGLGQTYNLEPPLDNATSSIQIIGCTLALVNQSAVVDSQSRTILSLKPDLNKTTSTWSLYTGPVQEDDASGFNTTGDMFIDLWGLWYSSVPATDFPLAADIPLGSCFDCDNSMLSFVDLQLNQMLNLLSYNNTDRPQTVTLHALENSLSTIVASMFWTLGNAPPLHGYMIGAQDANGHSINTIADTLPDGFSALPGGIGETFKRPFLQPGNATVTARSIETRLDLSIIAVIGGLLVSIALLLLSLPSSLFHRGNGADIPLEGTGLLHSVWLYRNHRELETLLEQVEHPTHDNLRAAGMVRTTLVENRNRKSFLMARRGSSRKNEQDGG